MKYSHAGVHTKFILIAACYRKGDMSMEAREEGLP